MREGGLKGETVIHVALTAVMGWLGFILIVPGSTFNTSLTFNVMARMGSEELWALSFWCAATGGIIGLGTRSKKVRTAAVLLLSTMYGIMASCMLTANPLSTGSGTYAIFAGLGYYLAWGQGHARS